MSMTAPASLCTTTLVGERLTEMLGPPSSPSPASTASPASRPVELGPVQAIDSRQTSTAVMGRASLLIGPTLYPPLARVERSPRRCAELATASTVGQHERAAESVRSCGRASLRCHGPGDRLRHRVGAHSE